MILDPRSWIQYPGYRIRDPGSWIQDSRPWIQDPAARISDTGSMIQDPEFWIRDPRSRILDPGSSILDPSSWVQDPGSRAWCEQETPALSYTRVSLSRKHSHFFIQACAFFFECPFHSSLLTCPPHQNGTFHYNSQVSGAGLI